MRALSAASYTARQLDSAITHIFGVDSQLIAGGTYYSAVADDRIVGCGGWSKRATVFSGEVLPAAHMVKSLG